MYRLSRTKHNLNSACKKSESPREESPAAMQWGQERVGLSHSMERQALCKQFCGDRSAGKCCVPVQVVRAVCPS